MRSVIRAVLGEEEYAKLVEHLGAERVKLDRIEAQLAKVETYAEGENVRIAELEALLREVLVEVATWYGGSLLIRIEAALNKK